MANGTIQKLPLTSDYERFGELDWQGTRITAWRNGNMCTLAWNGVESGTIATGAKNQYITIPGKYCPVANATAIFVDQNNKRFIFQCTSNGQAGLYYQLDAVTSATNVYGTLTWPCRGY